MLILGAALSRAITIGDGGLRLDGLRSAVNGSGGELDYEHMLYLFVVGLLAVLIGGSFVFLYLSYEYYKYLRSNSGENVPIFDNGILEKIMFLEKNQFQNE